MTPETLLSTFEHPPALAREASARRNRLLGPHVRVRPAIAAEAPPVAARERDGALEQLDSWPAAADLRDGDRLIVQVDPTDDARLRFAGWLHEMAGASVTWSVAPYSREAAGVHRLWCIAAARLCLPATARVEVRHDLVGIRLAQIALGFGADTLAGPVEPDRKLPLAGVPRPTEATLAGLHTMVRQTGLAPEDQPGA